MAEKIFLATGNPDKIRELENLFSSLNLSLSSTLDYPGADDVVEDRETLSGNALKKARYWHQKTNLPVLADDTGLEVAALNGAPGVYSARYAGEKASYEQNVEKLLSELQHKENRDAQFRTVVAYIDSAGEEHLFEGVCRGRIISKISGQIGFGYDPVFVPEGYNKTFAEISSEEKNRISHRGIAIQKFLRYLK